MTESNSSAMGIPAAASESLADRLVGLMMIRNESDILEDVLRNCTVFSDRIYVLDGSDPEEHEKTREICGRFVEVKAIIRDADTQGPFPVRDGARHYLLQRARAEHGSGRWIAVLHGDEFHTRDPRPFLFRADPTVTPVVILRLCHFFLHRRDEKDWDRLRRLPVEKRVTSYMWPGTPEDRFFYDDPRYDYNPAHHSLVVPYTRPEYARFEPPNLVAKQYNYRTPAQMTKRARERIDSGWQKNHYQHIVQESLTFVDSLHVPGFDPCGWDNVVEPDRRKHSAPRHLETAPLISLTDKPRPVFIGGTGRSGTTLVKRLLGAHPGIASVRPEAKFISADHGLMDMLCNGAGGFSEFRRRMQDFTPVAEEDYTDRNVDNWGTRAHDGAAEPNELYATELDHLEELLVNRDTPPSLRRIAVAEFIRIQYDRLVVPKNALAWVEQTPRNLRWGRELLSLFPEALFVHVHRDPRDVICSLLKMWWGPATVAEAIPYFRERWEQWRETRRGIVEDANGGRLVEIRFETLVESAGRHGVDAILGKLGLPAMAVSIDARRAHIGRWRTELDKASLRLVERELGDVLAEGGYRKAGPLARFAQLGAALSSVTTAVARMTRT